MDLDSIIVKMMFKKQSMELGETQMEIVVEQLENGFTKRYQRGRLLGKGGFAECLEFISEETGRRYAAKVICKETLAKGKAKEKLQSEILIHRGMRHQHIVKFEHFFEDHQNVYILLELCCNNTLNELLKRRKVLTEAEVRFYMVQIMLAVRYIHNNKVIHRDLKLSNFFLSEGMQVKVGDFGLATALSHEEERRRTVCGTPNYIAPEILQGKRGHSYEVDIWSLGVIAFALLFGKPPFETNQVQATYEKIKICQYTFPKTNVSPTARSFISSMLQLNPAHRATIDQLMAHQFITLSPIPKTLPLSTLACPPSSAFLEQLAREQRPPSESKLSQHEESQGLGSSRTHHPHPLLGQQRFDSLRPPARSRKSQRSTGSITRTISNAVHPMRKKWAWMDKVWVGHWEEHPKYGLFYLLSDGTVGMRFNDITCLTTTHSLKKFKYAVLRNNQEVEVELFESGQERQALGKKLKILSHFHKELKSKTQQKQVKEGQGQMALYVLAHFSTTNSTLFWLSNSTFHAKFKDDTEMLVEGDNVAYLTKDKREIILTNERITTAAEDIRNKHNHMIVLIRKIKKSRLGQQDDKKQMKEHKQHKDKADKENHTNMHSSSSSKLIKSREPLKRQFASTANLHLHKKPLSQYISNK